MPNAQTNPSNNPVPQTPKSTLPKAYSAPMNVLRTSLVLALSVLTASATPLQSIAAEDSPVQVRGHTRGDLTLPGLAFIKPARGLFEAFPLGNGTLGTMDHGGVQSTTFALSSDRLWEDWLPGEDGLPQTRAQPLAANLNFAFTLPEGTQFVREYTRALNFANGIAQTSFEGQPVAPDQDDPDSLHGPQHFRTAFASSTANVFVFHISSAEPTDFELTLSPDATPTGPHEIAFPTLGRIAFNAVTPARAGDAIAYQVLCSVVPSDGEMHMGEDAISVTDTTETTILVAITSSLQDPADTPADQHFTKRASAIIDAALATYERTGMRGLVDEHVLEHERLFKKLFVRIGPTQYNNRDSQALLAKYPTTDARLSGARAGDKDTYMPELLFYLGRYLQVASAQRGAKPGNMPAYFGKLANDPQPARQLGPGNTFWAAKQTGLSELIAPTALTAGELSTHALEELLAGIDSKHPASLRRASSALAMMHFARAHDGERALERLDLAISNIDLQPNLISQKAPFGIEMNLAITTAIGDMLMQSHDGIIELLPALPKDWDQGQFDGFTTGMGFQLAAGWSENKLDLCMVTSTEGGLCQIRMDNKPTVAVWQEGRAFLADDFEQVAERAFPIKFKDGTASWKTIAGATYAVIP